MNALIEVRQAPPAIQTVEALAQARQFIECGRYADASDVYTGLLGEGSALDEDLRSEIQTNLAAALCLLAQQSESAPAALDQLDRAKSLLHEALDHRRRTLHPVEWAYSRINLAIVHMTRFDYAADGNDLLSAHLALDGTQAVLASSNDAGLDWARAIHDKLVEVCDRRGRRR